MSGKTIEDLKALRDELVESRRREAYRISGAGHDEQIGKLVQTHLAIEALDTVILLGDGEPDTPQRMPEAKEETRVLWAPLVDGKDDDAALT
jgi:hypothetical protein